MVKFSLTEKSTFQWIACGHLSEAVIKSFESSWEADMGELINNHHKDNPENFLPPI